MARTNSRARTWFFVVVVVVSTDADCVDSAGDRPFHRRPIGSGPTSNGDARSFIALRLVINNAVSIYVTGDQSEQRPPRSPYRGTRRRAERETRWRDGERNKERKTERKETTATAAEAAAAAAAAAGAATRSAAVFPSSLSFSFSFFGFIRRVLAALTFHPPRPPHRVFFSIVFAIDDDDEGRK